MKDHYYIDERGQRIATADLPTETIQKLLAEGVEICGSDGEEPNVENVLERLRIELLIRSMGLR